MAGWVQFLLGTTRREPLRDLLFSGSNESINITNSLFVTQQVYCKHRTLHMLFQFISAILIESSREWS